ncbi:hypothetical protein [Robertmurraya siralis]|uniref:hypothetical protein n=1 Tax=Robertmurraya siralis TaxID=77777 RepID=UPI000BA6CBD3|nr:hypothetical protein [Robertmurraya siralis]PAE19290.1 hypothetical protein CHH80_16950 [Bacillus sp. 7504-2]
MNTANIYFKINELEYTDSGYRISVSYSFWKPLMNYILAMSDSIEIRCWNDEKEVINELKERFLTELVYKVERNETVFSGALTPKIAEYLTSNFLGKENQLKWFSLFFHRKGRFLFSSEHNGTEFVGYDFNTEQIETIKKRMPNNINFHTW